MMFRQEVDGAFTGDPIVNSVKLEGKMKESQKEYFARQIAAKTMRIAERHGYGLGECGFYLMRDAGELVECDLATNNEASWIVNRAEELMYAAEDMGAVLIDEYNSYFEEARRVEA